MHQAQQNRRLPSPVKWPSGALILPTQGIVSSYKTTKMTGLLHYSWLLWHRDIIQRRHWHLLFQSSCIASLQLHSIGSYKTEPKRLDYCTTSDSFGIETSSKEDIGTLFQSSCTAPQQLPGEILWCRNSIQCHYMQHPSRLSRARTLTLAHVPSCEFTFQGSLSSCHTIVPLQSSRGRKKTWLIAMASLSLMSSQSTGSSLCIFYHWILPLTVCQCRLVLSLKRGFSAIQRKHHSSSLVTSGDTVITHQKNCMTNKISKSATQVHFLLSAMETEESWM